MKSRTASHAQVADAVYAPEKSGDIVGTDLAGPVKPPSIGGAKYAHIFADHWDKGVDGYGCQTKSSMRTVTNLRRYLVKVGRVKTLRCDRGTEFMDNFERTAALAGVAIRRTARYSPV